ncbi:hypothetical protein ACWD6I_00395 [Streptomyces sp. NPDC002454]
MLKYEDIIDAPVGKLKAAADDWAEMERKLDRLAQDAADGMQVRANQARWEGVNAGVTKEFIAKTAKEFADAAAEAKGVKLILEEAHAAIKKAKDDLVSIRDDEGPAARIHVDAKGKVTARNPVEDIPPAQRMRDPDYPLILEQQRKAVDSWQKKIDTIVDNCNDVDVSFKKALEANVTDRKDFSAPKYTNLDQEEAARAAALAAKGRDLTHTELQSLNELLRENGKSVEFSKNFYEKLGPEKSLAFFGQLSTDTYDRGKIDKERLKDVQELQRNLGLNLATASHDKAFTAEWGPELRKLGTERIQLEKYDYNKPFGYQLLGGIMRYGNYDAKFLNPIAEHVAQLHQKDSRLFAENKSINGPFKNPFNPSGVNGAGYDPMTAMLEALGNSPEAAKRFFTDPPTAYERDGSVDHKATADLGKANNVPIDNYLDYFGTEKWDGFADITTHDMGDMKESLNHMPDALGKALEAATLGYPAGQPDGSVVRDAENADLMRKVMEKYGSDTGLLKNQEALSDSLGNMGAGYIDDINWALDLNDKDSVFASGRDAEGRLDFSDNTPYQDGRDIARDFLSALGQHPDAYATLATAEQVYTRSVMESQVGPEGKIDTGGTRSALFVGSEVQGMLDKSRADQVEAEGLKAHEEYEKAVQKRAGLIQFGAAIGVTAGVAFFPATAAVGTAAVLIPLAQETGGMAVEQVVGQVVGDISGSSIEEHKKKTEELIGDETEGIYKIGERRTEAPMISFLDLHEDAIKEGFPQDLKESMQNGYSRGQGKEDQQGKGPETG